MQIICPSECDSLSTNHKYVNTLCNTKYELKIPLHFVISNWNVSAHSLFILKELGLHHFNLLSYHWVFHGPTTVKLLHSPSPLYPHVFSELSPTDFKAIYFPVNILKIVALSNCLTFQLFKKNIHAVLVYYLLFLSSCQVENCPQYQWHHHNTPLPIFKADFQLASHLRQIIPFGWASLGHPAIRVHCNKQEQESRQV